MIIETRHANAGIVFVRVGGEIDMLTVDTFRDTLDKITADSEVANIVVDFAGVSFCDSAGIRALDAAYAAAAGRGVGFRLTHARASVRRVLQIVGVWDALTGHTREPAREQPVTPERPAAAGPCVGTATP